MKVAFNMIVLLFLSLSALGQQQYYVLFEYDKAEVPDTAMAFLIKTIYSNEVNRIYLEGHCDSIGSRAYNYDLSERRVKAVQQLLIDNGYDRNKIEGIIGFGKEKPLTPNNSDEARQLNRRVLVRLDIEKTSIDSTNKVASKLVTKKSEIVNVPVKKMFTNKRIAVLRAQELKAENFKPNNIIALPGLLFQGGRHLIINESSKSLDTLLQILKNNKDLRIEIQGHVCCTTYQKDGYDWDTRTDNLSENRADAILNFLVKNGISSTRLRTKGFGGSKKLFPDEENEYQRQQNRRVEVMVLPD